jgi:hypothetical protein
MLRIDLWEHHRDDASLAHFGEHEDLVRDPTSALESLSEKRAATLTEWENMLGGRAT